MVRFLVSPLKQAFFKHAQMSVLFDQKSESALLTSDKSWRGGIWKADLCFPLTNRRNLERVGACARHVKRQLFIISYLLRKGYPKFIEIALLERPLMFSRFFSQKIPLNLPAWCFRKTIDKFYFPWVLVFR